MTKSKYIKWSKNNPRPKPIGYMVSGNRKYFPPHLFDIATGNDPIPQAMEEFYRRYYRYPKGVTPIYADSKCSDSKNISK